MILSSGQQLQALVQRILLVPVPDQIRDTHHVPQEELLALHQEPRLLISETKINSHLITKRE
jgi:hypothetical protein